MIVGAEWAGDRRFVPCDIPDWPEGLRRDQIVTGPDEQVRLVAHSCKERVDQGALADAGLTAHQDDSAARQIEVVEEAVEEFEFRLSLEHDGCHVRIACTIPLGPRHGHDARSVAGSSSPRFVSHARGMVEPWNEPY